MSIHGLRVVATPGHTSGHLCLLDEDHGLLFTGDAIGAEAGRTRDLAASQHPVATVGAPLSPPSRSVDLTR